MIQALITAPFRAVILLMISPIIILGLLAALITVPQMIDLSAGYKTLKSFVLVGA